MKLCVVVPSVEHLKTAGVRIRYQRLQKKLKERDCDLSIRSIDTLLDTEKLNDDIYLISKVYDIRAVVLMRTCKQRNRLVGIDFFDNYFSQDEDPRFERQRDWVRTLQPYTDFSLCATERMKTLLNERLLVGTPCHVVNDPYDRFDSRQVADSLAARARRAKISKTINICWFGIGHNPYFPVGLTDLHAYRDYLAPFRTSGYRANVTILSNLRVQKVDTLAMLSRLGLNYDIREWSEAAEKDLVSEADVSFLPVNAQSFSTVKSLNRAVSALCGGSQVLSAGFPLYQALDDFIYRDVATLIGDWEQDRLAVRKDTLTLLEDKLNDLSNPEVEAAKLDDFLKSISPRDTPPTKRHLFVIHGRRTTAINDKYIKKHDGLSIGTPFSPPALNYDIELEFKASASGQPEIRLSEAAKKLLLPKFQRFLEKRTVAVDQRRLYVLPLAKAHKEGRLDILSHVNNSSRYTALVWYGMTIEAISDLVRRLFGQVDIYLAEAEAPFRQPATLSTSEKKLERPASDLHHA